MTASGQADPELCTSQKGEETKQVELVGLLHPGGSASENDLQASSRWTSVHTLTILSTRTVKHFLATFEPVTSFDGSCLAGHFATGNYSAGFTGLSSQPLYHPCWSSLGSRALPHISRDFSYSV